MNSAGTMPDQNNPIIISYYLVMFWDGAMKHYKNHIATTLACIFLLSAAGLRAAPPTVNDARDSETTEAANAVQAENRLSEQENTVNRYQDRIRQLEAEHGVYDSAIAEALLGLGMAYKDMKNHSEAVDTFKRALQISRVNNGLQSLEQLPYLEFLIQENAALGNWEEVNNDYHYLFWLYKRNFGDNDPRLLPVIDRVTRSQVAIFNASPDMFTARNLREREDMETKAVEIIKTNYGENDPRLIDAYNQLAVTNYYLALQTGYFGEYRKYRHLMLQTREPFRTVTTQVRVPIGVVNGTVIYGVQTIQIPDPTRPTDGVYVKPEAAKQFDLIKRTEIDGKLALNKIEKLHEHNPQLSVYSRALALTHQGDWRLLYESGRGMKQYREAQELLSQADNGQEYIQRLFGQPRPLPSFLSETEESLTAAPTTEKLEEKPGQNYLEVSYDVTPAGRAVNIRVINRPAGADDAIIQRVKWHLANVRFRPRFENAEPVMAKDLKVRYAVDAKGQVMAEAG